MLVALTAIGAVVFWNSLQGQFVYDDLSAIRDNAMIQKLWPIGDVLSLTERDVGLTTYSRPALSLTLALNYCLLGQEPLTFHLVNLVIHVGGAFLLLGIIHRTLRQSSPGRAVSCPAIVAFMATTVWLVHPIQTASVTYIVQRAESQAGFFLLLTLYASIRSLASPKPAAWWAVSGLACCLGVATKQSVAAGPLLVVLYDFVFVDQPWRRTFTRRWPLYVCLLGSWFVLSGLIMAYHVGHPDSDFTARSPLHYAQGQPEAILFYLFKCFWPSGLAMDYSEPSRTAAGIVLSVMAIAVLVAMTLWGLLRRHWMGFLGAWFFLILAPSSSLAALIQHVQIHRMYLPLAAVAVAATVAGYQLLKRLPPVPAQWIGFAVAGIVILALGGTTILRNGDFFTQERLWRANLEVDPGTAIAWSNLGLILEERGEIGQAVAHYRRAIALDAACACAHNNLGLIHARQGQLDLALASFQRAVQARPTVPLGNYNLAIALAQSGQKDQSILHYRQAIRFSSGFAQAYNNLGLLLLERGEIEQARECFGEALKMKPDLTEAKKNLRRLERSR